MSAILSSFFLAVLIPDAIAASLSFNLPAIGPLDARTNVITNGNASITENGIQLTPEDLSLWQRGRATYIKPLDLWDNDSGNITSFSSNFSFVIDSRGRTQYADGLAFFLAPVDSNVIGSGYTSPSTEPFVAVEFDTFVNPEWDPPYTHVGINIISIRSRVNASWPNNITGGAENNAWINYDASSKVLKVDYTSFPGNGRTRIDTLSYVIDLKQHLPERVIFGFSASTGALSEKHTIKSWNFSSQLDLNVVSHAGPAAAPTPDVPRKGNINSDGKANEAVLIVRLSVGLLVLILSSGF